MYSQLGFLSIHYFRRPMSFYLWKQEHIIVLLTKSLMTRSIHSQVSPISGASQMPQVSLYLFNLSMMRHSGLKNKQRAMDLPGTSQIIILNLKDEVFRFNSPIRYRQ